MGFEKIKALKIADVHEINLMLKPQRSTRSRCGSVMAPEIKDKSLHLLCSG